MLQIGKLANFSIFWCISEVNIWRCHVNKAKRMHLKIINPWDTKLIVHCTLIYSTEAHYNLKKLNLLVPWPQSSTLCVFLLLHHLQNSPRFGLFGYLYLFNARGGRRIKMLTGVDGDIDYWVTGKQKVPNTRGWGVKIFH